MREKREWIVSSFSYPADMRTILKELDIIAVREDKTRSELVCDLIKDYVKSHAEGNSTFKLDQWQEDPEFKAIPTILSKKEKWSSYVEECSDKECTDIALMSRFIFEEVGRRRQKEHNIRKKENTGIYQYYKNKQ